MNALFTFFRTVFRVAVRPALGKAIPFFAASLVAYAAFPAGMPVSRFLTGQNYWFSPPDSGYPLIMDSGVTLMRIGGRTFDNTPLSHTAILKQVDNMRAAGMEPLIQVSRHLGAAAAADLVNTLNIVNGRAVKFWSIGNEPDLGWTGTETDLAAYVASYIKAIAPAMRDVDPTITLCAPDMAFYSQKKYEELLGGGADITGRDAKGRYYVNCINLHRYPFNEFFSRNDVLAEMHGGFETRVVALTARIGYANALQGRVGGDALTWGLTEFNLTVKNPASGNTPEGLGVTSFLNGQFFAEYYRVGMKYGVEMMNTWSLLEGNSNSSAGDLGYLGNAWSAPIRRSSYYHMQLIADYFVPGGYLPSASSTDTLGVLSTSAVNQQSLSVMLLNESTVGSQTLTMRLNDEPVIGPGAKVNIAAGMAREHTFVVDNQTTVVLIFDQTGAVRHRITYSLPRYQQRLAPLVETLATGGTATAPTNVTAAAANARVALAWNGPGNAESYNVKRATVSGGPYVTVAAGVITPGYTDTTVNNGITYYYVVTSAGAVGESANSAQVAATPQHPSSQATITFEAEAMAFTSAGTSTSVNIDVPASGGKWVQLNATAAGPFMEFTTGTIAAGSYIVELTYKANNNRGRCSLAIDGATINDALDQYASMATFQTVSVGTVTFESSGTHKIRLTAGGKNPASTGFLLSADKFRFLARTPVTILLSNLDQVYDGAPKPVTVSTHPASAPVAVTYNGSSTAPTLPGTYAVVARLTDINYVGSATETLVIARAPAQITLSNLEQSFDGTPKPADVRTEPAGLSVNVTYNGSLTPPSRVGSYSVKATVSTTTYVGSASGSLVIRDTTPPVLSIPDTITVEATGPAGARVSFEGQAQDSVDGVVPVAFSHAADSIFPIGATIVIATATDAAGNRATAQFSIVVRDTTAPRIAEIPDKVVEATSPEGAVITLSATATDLVDGIVPVSFTPASGTWFALGRALVTASAADAAGNAARRSFAVLVRDTTAPVIAELKASTTTLWPPNHQMVAVSLDATLTDAVDRSPQCRIIAVQSNESTNAPGDGNTAVDWEITGALTLNLRAERSGSGTGRVYTVSVEATDAAGNVSQQSIEIIVPSSRASTR